VRVATQILHEPEKVICHLKRIKASESKNPFIIKQLAIVIFNILADFFLFDYKKFKYELFTEKSTSF
jgi:hypothetical protein